MDKILTILNEHYPICFDRLELIRDMGSTAYAAFAGEDKYFLRILKPAFMDTALKAVDIQVFLQGNGFPVPPIVSNKENSPYLRDGNDVYVLYEYIEGTESKPEQDACAIGALVGRLHQLMKEYHGELVVRDKQFYIGRYISYLRKIQYPRADEFSAYGEALWDRVKDLPRGFCHGDMYDGNILKTPDGRLFVLDFDTSCIGFPMYDPTLICNMTQYFEYDERNYERSKMVLSRFLPEYLKFNTLSQAEIDAFCDLIAIQHFSTQATVMEIYGLDCLDGAALDDQLDWLYRRREQCNQAHRG